MPLDDNKGKAKTAFKAANEPQREKAPPQPPTKPTLAPALRPNGRLVQEVHTAVENERKAQTAQHAQEKQAKAAADFKAKMVAKQTAERSKPDHDRGRDR